MAVIIKNSNFFKWKTMLILIWNPVFLLNWRERKYKLLRASGYYSLTVNLFSLQVIKHISVALHGGLVYYIIDQIYHKILIFHKIIYFHLIVIFNDFSIKFNDFIIILCKCMWGYYIQVWLSASLRSVNSM